MKVLIFVIAVLLALVLGLYGYAVPEPLAPRNNDEWFAMAVAIQRDIDQADFENRQIKSINAEDRRFVQKMLNELSATDDAIPTKRQARWLLSIKEWVAK